MAIAAHAPVSQRDQDRLPDKDFAYVEPGGTHDKPGFTKPRAKRHLLIKDASHVHTAEARFNQTKFHSEAAKRSAWRKIQAAAKRTGAKLRMELGADGKLHEKQKAAQSSHPHPGPLPVGEGNPEAEGVRLAAHSVAMAEDGTAPEWIELVPAGRFTGRDGRGPFVNDDPEAVIAASKALGMTAGLPIDYDHATDFGAPEGRPAPAAGWIKELAARDGAVWGRVEWTEAGAAAVKAKEYRYISPVFQFARHPGADEETESGTVTLILRAALTNNPNLNLTAIAESRVTMPTTTQAKKSKISALVEQIKDASEEMGLPVDTLLEGISHQLGGDLEDPDHDGEQGEGAAAAEGFTGDESEEEMAARHAREMDEAEPEDREEMAKRHEHERADLARKKREREEASRHASRNIATHPMVVRMARELRDLRAERTREKAEMAVAEAIRARKLPPSQREWAVNYCIADAEGFAAFVKNQPTLLPAAPVITGAPRSGAAAGLSREALAICTQLKLEPEKYAAEVANTQAAI